MNFANKPPLGQKQPKKKKNEKFLNKVREMRCCVCQRFGEVQNSPTTAHHPIHDRYSMRKLGIIGLGYVGLPLAVEFGKSIPTSIIVVETSI